VNEKFGYDRVLLKPDFQEGGEQSPPVPRNSFKNVGWKTFDFLQSPQGQKFLAECYRAGLISPDIKSVLTTLHLAKLLCENVPVDDLKQGALYVADVSKDLVIRGGNVTAEAALHSWSVSKGLVVGGGTAVVDAAKSTYRYIPVIPIPEKLSVEGLKEGTSYCWDSCKDYSNKGSETIVGGAQYVMSYIPSWQTGGKELEEKESQE